MALRDCVHDVSLAQDLRQILLREISQLSMVRRAGEKLQQLFLQRIVI
jgi:hypothetical protein